MKKWIIILLLVGFKQALADDRLVVELSPLHFMNSIIELGVEQPLDENSSAFLILGRGETTTTDGFVEVTTVFWFFGGQYRYYINQELDGLHLGIEAQYLIANANEDGFKGKADGLLIGPFLGWKEQWDFGFVFNIQVGYQKLFITKDEIDRNGNNITGEINRDLILLNLNLGWSF